MTKEELKKEFEEEFNYSPLSVIEPYWDWFAEKIISASHPLDAEVILPKPNPTCENCKYYQDINTWGYCKFNPPFTKKEQRQKSYNGIHSDLIEDVLHTEWTKVSNYDWCGQFEQREARSE